MRQEGLRRAHSIGPNQDRVAVPVLIWNLGQRTPMWSAAVFDPAQRPYVILFEHI
jgi:hypothetical protein